MAHRQTPPLSLDPAPAAKQVQLQEAATAQQRLFSEAGPGAAPTPPQVCSALYQQTAARAPIHAPRTGLMQLRAGLGQLLGPAGRAGDLHRHSCLQHQCGVRTSQLCASAQSTLQCFHVQVPALAASASPAQPSAGLPSRLLVCRMHPWGSWPCAAAGQHLPAWRLKATCRLCWQPWTAQVCACAVLCPCMNCLQARWEWAWDWC